ncbi:hypothetical protein BDV06DRAFT_217888 [Aspergillus oleicola]
MPCLLARSQEPYKCCFKPGWIRCLKIYYNTTTPGHVTWIGREWLLYKEMNFTISKFHSFIYKLVRATRELIIELFTGPAHYIATYHKGFYASNNIKIIHYISYQFLCLSSIFPNNIQTKQEQELATIKTNRDPDGISNIADKQARYTPHMAGLIYRRQATELEVFRISQGGPPGIRKTGAAAGVVTGHKYKVGVAANNQPQDYLPRDPRACHSSYPGWGKPGSGYYANWGWEEHELGIQYISWESCYPPNKAAIILVMPESTKNPDFHTFLNQQRFLRRLD